MRLRRIMKRRNEFRADTLDAHDRRRANPLKEIETPGFEAESARARLAQFLQADVQTTIGPYLAIFLRAVRHRDTGKIGIAISVPGIVAIIAQTPMGALVDWTARKRILVMVSAVALGTGALLLIAADSFAIVTLGQTTIAVASTVIPPAIASISLGLVGRRWFAQRMGRNEAYSHGGALTAAIGAAVIGYWFSQSAIFFFAAGQRHW